MDLTTRNRWLATASIVAGGLAAYASSYSGVFVLDDFSSIPDNPTIRHLGDLRRVLTPLRGEGLTVDGRPVLNLSFALNYAFGGAAVGGYHAVNVLIHVLAGLALWGILRRLSGLDGPSWAAALIWTVHPLCSGAVTYVVQRAESLMGLFYLLTVYWFIRWSAISERAGHSGCSGPESGWAQRARRSRSTYACLSVGMCWLGMGTKEVMVSAPLMVLLIDRWFIAGSFGAAWRARRGYYLALAASWLLLAGLVWHTGSRGGTSGFGSGVAAVQYWLTQPGAILRYLRLSVWPHPLVFDYGVEWVARPAAAILPGLMVLGLAAGTVHGLVRNRVWGVLGFFFFAVLAPTSLVPGNRQTAAEQRMYLALIAVVVGAVYGARWVVRRHTNAVRPSAPGGRAPLTLLSGVLIAGVLGIITDDRNRDYRSPLVLYGADVAHLPNNAYAQTNYATALLFAKQYPQAKEHFETALRLKPDLAETEDNLGNALLALGKFSEAEAHYRHVIALHPQFADAYTNLADAYLKEDRVQDARRAAEAALKLRPDLAGARGHLGLVLLREGRVPEAVNELQTATALQPDSADHWINYGNALRAARQPGAAARAFEQAAKLEPANAAVYYDWAGAETDLRQFPAADALLRTSLRLDGSNAAAHQNLGNALLAENQAAAAVKEYETAAKLAPNDAVIHYNFGNGLLRLGRRDDAAKELRAALAINPGLQPARALLEALGR